MHKSVAKLHFFLHMCNFCSTFAADFKIYGTTIRIFTRFDGSQFPVFRIGIGADVNLAQLYQPA